MSEYKTDRGRVIGLGSAKEGVHEWWRGRLTSVALIPLTLIFIVCIAPLVGEDYATVTAAFANPIKAVLAILFVLIAFKHLADGLAEVIVDYVHHSGTLAVTLIAAKFLCYGFGFAGAFAIAKIAFAA